jgi:hypothetical protein
MPVALDLMGRDPASGVRFQTAMDKFVARWRQAALPRLPLVEAPRAAPVQDAENVPEEGGGNAPAAPGGELLGQAAPKPELAPPEPHAEPAEPPVPRPALLDLVRRRRLQGRGMKRCYAAVAGQLYGSRLQQVASAGRVRRPSLTGEQVPVEMPWCGGGPPSSIAFDRKGSLLAVAFFDRDRRAGIKVLARCADSAALTRRPGLRF